MGPVIWQRDLRQGVGTAVFLRVIRAVQPRQGQARLGKARPGQARPRQPSLPPPCIASACLVESVGSSLELPHTLEQDQPHAHTLMNVRALELPHTHEQDQPHAHTLMNVRAHTRTTFSHDEISLPHIYIYIYLIEGDFVLWGRVFPGS